MRSLLVVFCLLLSAVALSQKKPEGFLWNNIHYDQKSVIKPEKTVRLSALPPSQQVAVLRYFTMSALHQLDLYPTEKNAYRFIRWNHFWQHQASLVSRVMGQAYLTYPEFDYSVAHPWVSAALPLVRKRKTAQIEQAVRTLSNRYGIFFFYRGKAPLDRKYATIVRDFAHAHGISVLAITLDGIKASAFPDSQLNNGQFAKLSIKALPALLLVDPQKHQIKPLAYGFISQDLIAYQFLMVARRFKEF